MKLDSLVGPTGRVDLSGLGKPEDEQAPQRSTQPMFCVPPPPESRAAAAATIAPTCACKKYRKVFTSGEAAFSSMTSAWLCHSSQVARPARATGDSSATGGAAKGLCAGSGLYSWG